MHKSTTCLKHDSAILLAWFQFTLGVFSIPVGVCFSVRIMFFVCKSKRTHTGIRASMKQTLKSLKKEISSDKTKSGSQRRHEDTHQNSRRQSLSAGILTWHQDFIFHEQFSIRLTSEFFSFCTRFFFFFGFCVLLCGVCIAIPFLPVFYSGCRFRSVKQKL